TGDKVYELDPLTGESREQTWISGKTLQLPESGESWGLIQRNDGLAEIIDFDARRSVLVLPKETRTFATFRQFPDNRHAVVLYQDKTFDVWDTAERRLVKQAHTAEIPYIAKVSQDGRWLALGYFGNGVSLWDTATWTERTLRPLGGVGIGGFMFS